MCENAPSNPIRPTNERFFQTNFKYTRILTHTHSQTKSFARSLALVAAAAAGLEHEKLANANRRREKKMCVRNTQQTTQSRTDDRRNKTLWAVNNKKKDRWQRNQIRTKRKRELLHFASYTCKHIRTKARRKKKLKQRNQIYT